MGRAARRPGGGRGARGVHRRPWTLGQGAVPARRPAAVDRPAAHRAGPAGGGDPRPARPGRAAGVAAPATGGERHRAVGRSGPAAGQRRGGRPDRHPARQQGAGVRRSSTCPSPATAGSLKDAPPRLHDADGPPAAGHRRRRRRRATTRGEEPADEEAAGETLRLLYVGLTRAKSQVVAWWAASKNTAVVRAAPAAVRPAVGGQPDPGVRSRVLPDDRAAGRARRVAGPRRARGRGGGDRAAGAAAAGRAGRPAAAGGAVHPPARSVLAPRVLHLDDRRARPRTAGRRQRAGDRRHRGRDHVAAEQAPTGPAPAGWPDVADGRPARRDRVRQPGARRAGTGGHRRRPTCRPRCWRAAPSRWAPGPTASPRPSWRPACSRCCTPRSARSPSSAPWPTSRRPTGWPNSASNCRWPAATGRRGTLTLGAVADLLGRHLPADDPLADYPDRLAAPELADTPLRGYLTGSLDAVLRLPGPRYLVVDYKTNRLGDPSAEVLPTWDYRPAAMAGRDDGRPLSPAGPAVFGRAAPVPAVAPARIRPGRAPRRGAVPVRPGDGRAGHPGHRRTPAGVFGWRPPAAAGRRRCPRCSTGAGHDRGRGRERCPTTTGPPCVAGSATGCSGPGTRPARWSRPTCMSPIDAADWPANRTSTLGWRWPCWSGPPAAGPPVWIRPPCRPHRPTCPRRNRRAWLARAARTARCAGRGCRCGWIDGLLYLDRYWQEESQVCADLLAREAGPPPAVDLARAAAAATRLIPAGEDPDGDRGAAGRRR